MKGAPPRGATGTAVAFFITPHGFGHAARAAAVAAALRRKCDSLRPELFTSVPQWFFDDSLEFPFGYHAVECDLGMVQRSSLEEDPAATCARLDEMLPFPEELVDRLARRVLDLGCRGVVCDIAPLGVAVAREAGLPSVLVESFTWDWIYAAYEQEVRGLARHGRWLRSLFEAAEIRIQTAPACVPLEKAVQVPPVSRAPRATSADVRRRLGVPEGDAMVLFSMGGVPWQFHGLEQLQHIAGCTFVVPGGGERAERRENVVLLPHRSGFHHPDLVHASDACVAKLGYSTVAEAYAAGTKLAFVPRRRFPESPMLAGFVNAHMNGVVLTETDLAGPGLREIIPRLLDAPRQSGGRENGAGPAAATIRHVLRLGR